MIEAEVKRILFGSFHLLKVPWLLIFIQLLILPDLKQLFVNESDKHWNCFKGHVGELPRDGVKCLWAFPSA